MNSVCIQNETAKNFYGLKIQRRIHNYLFRNTSLELIPLLSLSVTPIDKPLASDDEFHYIITFPSSQSLVRILKRYGYTTRPADQQLTTLSKNFFNTCCSIETEPEALFFLIKHRPHRKPDMTLHGYGGGVQIIVRSKTTTNRSVILSLANSRQKER